MLAKSSMGKVTKTKTSKTKDCSVRQGCRPQAKLQINTYWLVADRNEVLSQLLGDGGGLLGEDGLLVNANNHGCKKKNKHMASCQKD